MASRSFQARMGHLSGQSAGSGGSGKALGSTRFGFLDVLRKGGKGSAKPGASGGAPSNA